VDPYRKGYRFRSNRLRLLGSRRPHIVSIPEESTFHQTDRDRGDESTVPTSSSTRGYERYEIPSQRYQTTGSKAKRTRGFDHKSAKEHLVRTSTEDRRAGQDEGHSIRGGRREKQDRKSWLSKKNFPKGIKDIRKRHFKS
jgi:hypothetical protein